MESFHPAPSNKLGHSDEILRVAQGKEIQPQALLPGDLIFKYSGDQCLHVSIVTSANAESGAADHAHLLNDGRLSGLHITTVTTWSQLVLRCRNEELRTAAARFAARWTELCMPYANHRRKMATVHAAHVGKEVVAVHRKLFADLGKFRAIKFAARRDGDLIYQSEQDPRIAQNRGMFCSMFVVVCYQVAGLASIVHASPVGMRVSDKSTSIHEHKLLFTTELKTYGASKEDQRQFAGYLSRLNDVDPYKLFKNPSADAQKLKDVVKKAPRRAEPAGFGTAYQPSLAFWPSNTHAIATFDWPAHITTGMMVDAKVIMPDGLLLSLLDDVGDQGKWQVMGTLAAVKSYAREQKDEMAIRSHQQDKTRARWPSM